MLLRPKAVVIGRGAAAVVVSRRLLSQRFTGLEGWLVQVLESLAVPGSLTVLTRFIAVLVMLVRMLYVYVNVK